MCCGLSEDIDRRGMREKEREWSERGRDRGGGREQIRR